MSSYLFAIVLAIAAITTIVIVAVVTALVVAVMVVIAINVVVVVTAQLIINHEREEKEGARLVKYSGGEQAPDDSRHSYNCF